MSEISHGTFPMVTGLCLTRNRREFIPGVVRDFQSQDYPGPKELLIVNDEDAEGLDDLIPGDLPGVRVVTIPRANIGKKRNLGISLAEGEIVAQWDDDDNYSPGRLTDQITRLLDTGKQVTGYFEFKAKSRATEAMWIYSGSRDYACGASLCYWKSWWEGHKFPECSLGEDNMFISVANAGRVFCSAPGGDFIIVGVHPGNTDRKRVECPPWRILV